MTSVVSLVTRSLLKSTKSSSAVFVIVSRGYVSFKELKDEKPVYQYASTKRSRQQYIYGWGCSLSGGIGVPEFLFPDPKNHPRQLLKVHKPCRIPFGNKRRVTRIAAGYGFSLFSTNSRDGRKVYGTGLNPCGQIGFHPQKSDETRSEILLAEPRPINLPLVRPESTKVVELACGRIHSLVATDNEGVFGLGNNFHGQCGRPIVEDEDYATTSIVSSISGIRGGPAKVVCGLDHSLVLTDAGTVYSFGCGMSGQLGNGFYKSTWETQIVAGDISEENIVDISCAADCVLAVSDKGDVFGWGNSEYKQLASALGPLPQSNVPKHLPLNIGKVKEVAAGGSACAALTSLGQVFVWGFGYLGQGPATTNHPTPSPLPMPLFGFSDFQQDVLVTHVEAGTNHFAAITSQGDLYMWGKNEYGLLGIGHDRDQFFPLKVCMAGRVAKVACGAQHTIAITRPF